MGKIERTKVTVDASYYNFDYRFEEAMKQFEDVNVISISLLSSNHNGDSIREEYLVFHQEQPKEIDEEIIEAGDLVYWHDVNHGGKIYEMVEKVVFDDGMDKCFFVENEDSEGGFIALHEVTLVAKKKHRKDI